MRRINQSTFPQRAFLRGAFLSLGLTGACSSSSHPGSDGATADRAADNVLADGPAAERVADTLVGPDAAPADAFSRDAETRDLVDAAIPVVDAPAADFAQFDNAGGETIADEQVDAPPWDAADASVPRLDAALVD